MVALNVFTQDAFTTIQLTGYVERNPYVPTGLGELGLFTPRPVRVRAVAVEERDGKLTIIQTSPLGAPPQQRGTEQRKARLFQTTRLATADTVYATEIEGVRDFGQESALVQIQQEVTRRISGPTGLQQELELTRERHRLGAVQGVVLDADNSVIYDWFEEFGIPRPEVIYFDLAARQEGSLRPICNRLVRAMARASQGAFTNSTRVVGLCGDDFWDKLTTHPDVEKTFLNWSAAEELRRGGAFSAMPFGGIDWINYRGTDDGSTIAIPGDEVRFFPRGAPGVFEVAYAPAEFIPWVNTLGKQEYVIPVIDRDRNAWWKAELYSYPLFMCTRPEVLRSGSADADPAASSMMLGAGLTGGGGAGAASSDGAGAGDSDGDPTGA